MAIDPAEDLEDLVRKALEIADHRGLLEVALHLDQALIALTGTESCSARDGRGDLVSGY